MFYDHIVCKFCMVLRLISMVYAPGMQFVQLVLYWTVSVMLL